MSCDMQCKICRAGHSHFVTVTYWYLRHDTSYNLKGKRDLMQKIISLMFRWNFCTAFQTFFYIVNKKYCVCGSELFQIFQCVKMSGIRHNGLHAWHLKILLIFNKRTTVIILFTHLEGFFMLLNNKFLKL